MKSFEKTTTEVFEPLWVNKEFTLYTKGYVNIRKDLEYKANTCIKCNRKFQLDEMIGLACFKNIGNKVICVKCAEEISD